MHMLSITIATTNTAQRVIPKAVVPANSSTFSVLVFSYNGSNAMYLGDTTVNATTGVPLAKGVPLVLTPSLQFSGDLTEFWVYGTSADVLNVMVLD